MNTSADEPLPDLKSLITRGRSQGYLTYAEVSDYLPIEGSTPEQINDVTQILDDIGIPVRENPPSADDATEQHTQIETDTTDEEAVAVLSSAQADSNPTRDPMRTYLREMGGKALLTREGEIELAKRIEEGMREVQAAIACLPGTVEHVLEAYEAAEEETGLAVLMSGYLDPMDVIPTPPAVDPATGRLPEDEEDSPRSTGPDPIEARKRFASLRRAFNSSGKVIRQRGNRSSAGHELEKLGRVFAGIKFAPRQQEKVVSIAQAPLQRLRELEQKILTVCVNEAGMPRKLFLSEYRGNECSPCWLENQIDAGHRYSAVLSTRKKLFGVPRFSWMRSVVRRVFRSPS